MQLFDGNNCIKSAEPGAAEQPPGSLLYYLKSITIGCLLQEELIRVKTCPRHLASVQLT